MSEQVSLFLIIRIRPWLSLVSAAILTATAVFLAWLMVVEFLRCVITLFALCVLQWIGTAVYLWRRRVKYGQQWLETQAEDREHPLSRLIGVVLTSATSASRSGKAGPGTGIGAAVRASLGSGDVSPRLSQVLQ